MVGHGGREADTVLRVLHHDVQAADGKIVSHLPDFGICDLKAHLYRDTLPTRLHPL